jgi:hypothetical protein
MLVSVQTERRRDLPGEVRELPDLLDADTVASACRTAGSTSPDDRPLTLRPRSAT